MALSAQETDFVYQFPRSSADTHYTGFFTGKFTDLLQGRHFLFKCIRFADPAIQMRDKGGIFPVIVGQGVAPQIIEYRGNIDAFTIRNAEFLPEFPVFSLLLVFQSRQVCIRMHPPPFFSHRTPGL